jgi:acyl-CoA synthetase (AMP-forming)/AMP-acid ligase II
MSGTVWSVVAAHAERQPGAPAVSDSESGRRWSYAELVRDAEIAAQSMAALGIRTGEKVAVFADNCVATAIIWLACARIGAAVSVINALLAPRELASALSRISARLLFVDAGHYDTAAAAVRSADLKCLMYKVDDSPLALPSWESLLRGAGRSAGAALAEPLPDDVIEVSFTSGTTSTSKGVVFDNASYLFATQTLVGHYQLTASDVVYTVCPLFHATGMRCGLAPGLVAGGHVVIAPGFHPRTFWRDVTRWKATFAALVDTMLIILLRQEPSEWERQHSIWRIMGDIDPDNLDQVERRFGFRVYQMYGQTESMAVLATPLSLGDNDLNRARHARPGASYVGLPLHPDIRIRLVDDDGHDVGQSETGECLIRSPGLFAEYLGDPSATRETLRDGWLHTGDLCTRNEHGYYFVDRKKDMIRRGGENIASKEVEEVLESHPDVSEAAVIPERDAKYGQEVKAVVVPAPGRSIQPEALWAWCAGHLADFKVPRYVEIRSELPRNATGKIVKARLAAVPAGAVREIFDRLDVGSRNARR